MEFVNPIGWYAFAGLGALILIYLIKPKAIDLKMPSIMFLMKEKGTRQKSTFFKKFLYNLLFLLQFLIIGLLAFAAVSPLIDMKYDSTAENTVIVLDVSASMQAKDSSAATRFSKAVDIAKKSAKGTTTIILAESIPLIVLEKGSESKANEILSILKPKETGTNLGDSMMLANDLLGGGQQAQQADGRVVVISDFIWTEGADPEVIKAILESRGIVVDFINVAEKKKAGKGNVGFIDIDIGIQDTTLYVKNYFDEEKDITIEIKNENTTLANTEMSLPPNSIDTLKFTTLKGVTIAHIKPVDGEALDADNYVFMSNPKKSDINALIITNTPNKFLKNALSASGEMEVDIAEPPVVPELKNYELIIINDADPEKILPTAIDEIRAEIAKGKSLIVTYQKSIGMLELNELLPIKIKELLGDTSIRRDVENQFTKDVDFGSVKEHYLAEADNDTIVIATAVSSDSPVMAMKSLGKERGKLFYYGIDDIESDFKNSPSYPIFWNSIAKFMMGIGSMDSFNHKTGKVMAFDTETAVETPGNSMKTSKLVMDNAGIYVIQGKKHAANIANDRESDIYHDTKLDTKKAESYKPTKVVREKKVNLEMSLLISAMILVLLELVYTKFRGDF